MRRCVRQAVPPTRRLPQGDRAAGTMASASESMGPGVRAGKETVGLAGNLSGHARSMAEDARQSTVRLI
jgi:hypothetical protein